MANDKTFPEVKTNPLTEAAKKRLSRSMMFVPGNTPKMINSADIHGAYYRKRYSSSFDCRSIEIP